MHFKNWLKSAFFLSFILLLTSISTGDHVFNPSSESDLPRGVQLTNKYSDLPGLKPLDSMVNRIMRKNVYLSIFEDLTKKSENLNFFYLQFYCK